MIIVAISLITSVMATVVEVGCTGNLNPPG
jgi:hypothetical protein